MRQERGRCDTAPSRAVAPRPLPGGGLTCTDSIERNEDEVAALVQGGRSHTSLPLHAPHAAPRPWFTPAAVAEWRARRGMDGSTAAGPEPGGGRALPARGRSADAHHVSMRLSDRNQRNFVMPRRGSVVTLADVALATTVEGQVRAAITSLSAPTVSYQPVSAVTGGPTRAGSSGGGRVAALPPVLILDPATAGGALGTTAADQLRDHGFVLVAPTSKDVMAHLVELPPPSQVRSGVVSTSRFVNSVSLHGTSTVMMSLVLDVAGHVMPAVIGLHTASPWW